ncbi:MAG: dynamin family protein [Candidatus Tectomicrobia bacterium]|nr:dynamin family protein [Candidatus Tectomicrobia bacterium]
MNQGTSLTLRHELVRYQTIALLYRLTTTADELELPKPSVALTRARQQLETNDYNIVVMGEAKRGKTTLINALIGRSILPTDAGMAMRQAVRVSHAAQEAYRLRFEDGSHQDITATDVVRYGAQEAEPSEETPRPEHIMRCIEVEAPMQSLPEGMSLWDTPDMQALGVPPTRIIQRFALHADAVLYVLDSRQPMGQSDLDFIEAVLEVTPHIFFIQTQIDQYTSEQRECVRQSNQDILLSRFSNRLSYTQVWPVSSTKILQAVQSGHDEETTRRRDDLCAALQTFLFQVAGYRRVAEALMLAKHDHALSRQTLVGRLTALTETSQEELTALQHTAAERQQQFEAEWGPTGMKRQELLTSLQKVMAIGRRNFEAALQPGGDIDRTFQSPIKALTSMDAARQLSTKLHEEVVTAAINRWLQVCEFTQKECVSLMAPFFAEAVTLPQMVSQPHLQIGSEFNFEEEWTTKLAAGGRGMAALSTLTTIPMTVLVGATAMSGPLGILALAATGLWGFVYGWTSAGQAQLNDARDRLSKHVSTLLQDVRRYFFDTELAAESLSVVDQYFEGLRRFTLERIETLTTQKSSEARAEVARLFDQVPLDDAQRQVNVQQLQQHAATWETIDTTIQQLMASLDTLEHME